MLVSFIVSLFVGFVSGTLWRIATLVGMGLLVLWALFHLYEVYDGRRFIGRGMLALAAVFGLMFSNGLNNSKMTQLVDENKMLKDDLRQHEMDTEAIRKEAEACAAAVVEQNKAIVKAETQARKVEKIAKQSGVNQYRAAKAKAAVETRSADELNKWFTNVLSEYQP